MSPRIRAAATVALALALACRCRKTEDGTPPKTTPDTTTAAPSTPVAEATAPAAPASVSPSTAEAPPGPAAHDPAHPPIDCPLRKHGIDPANMKPFEETEEYIRFLDRPERAEWQKPDDVVAALRLRGDETVYDLGAGSGYFSFRFAAALPRGRVVAGDTEPEMIRHVHHRALSEGVANVQAELIEPTDPAVPPDADVVFVCDVLHHVGERSAWLARMADEMQTGARLVLIEFREGELPQGPPAAVKIPRAELLDMVTAAGLTFDGERDDLLPYQVFLVFKKP